MEKTLEFPQSQWVTNFACNPLIGFKNIKKEHTRSAYLSFPIKENPELTRIILKISTHRFDENKLSISERELVKYLIELAFLKPKKEASFKQLIKQKMSPLNRFRITTILFEGEKYVTTSFCFMSFFSKKEDNFIKEKVILTSWIKNFAELAFNIFTESPTLEKISSLPTRSKKKLEKYGLIKLKDSLDQSNLEDYFKKNCILSTQLLEALPPHYHIFLPREVSKNPYQLNEHIYFLSDLDTLPKPLLEGFCSEEWIRSVDPTIIIKDPVTQVHSLHWLDSTCITAIKGLQSGDTQIHNLQSDILTLLNLIRVVFTDIQLTDWKHIWAQKILDAQKQISTSKVIQLESILLPADFIVARLYLRHIDKFKYLIKDKLNGETSGRHWIHRDPYVFYLHTHLLTILNQIVDDKVKIGHNALTIYKKGSKLPIHRDDVVSFSWVISLPIETSPYKEKPDSWPIHVRAGQSKITSKLQSGDAIFIDPQMPHWREELTDHQLNIMFFWFLPCSYKGYVNGYWVE